MTRRPTPVVPASRRQFLAWSAGALATTGLAATGCSAPENGSGARKAAGASPSETTLTRIGLDYPYTQLPLYTTLVKLDTSLLEASADLGSRPWQTFLSITLPLSLPGIVAGSMLVFIPAIGEFVIPSLLGGPETLMIGRVLWDEFFGATNWPRAASVAVAMLVVVVIPILLLQKAQDAVVEKGK